MFFLGTLLTGYLAGFASFKTLISLSNQEVVSKDSIITNEEFLTISSELKKTKLLLESITKLTSKLEYLESNGKRLVVQLKDPELLSAPIDVSRPRISLEKRSGQVQQSIERWAETCIVVFDDWKPDQSRMLLHKFENYRNEIATQPPTADAASPEEGLGSMRARKIATQFVESVLMTIQGGLISMKDPNDSSQW